MVPQDAVYHRALQCPAEDSTNHLPKHVGAAAKRSPRIIVTPMARTVARTLEFTPTAGQLTNFRANLTDLPVGLLQSLARRRNSQNGLVVCLGWRLDGVLIELTEILAHQRLGQEIDRPVVEALHRSMRH